MLPRLQLTGPLPEHVPTVVFVETTKLVPTKVSVKVTLAVSGPLFCTTALKVSFPPKLAGSGTCVSVTETSVPCTSWVKTSEVLVVKLASPPYTAVILWLPAANPLVEKLATPALSVPVPSVLVLSLKVTVPVGVPAPGGTAVTVAVNITDCPKMDGLLFETTAVVVLD